MYKLSIRGHPAILKYQQNKTQIAAKGVNKLFLDYLIDTVISNRSLSVKLYKQM